MSRPILPGDPTFPPALLEMVGTTLKPCRLLRVRGVWPPAPGVAIVGARQATPQALAFTRDLAGEIVRAGWAVWSGGALGIDAAAHEGALRQGGSTVVVCPSGLDVVYPPEHRDLFARVVENGGTLVSPFADHVQALRHCFHRRNDVLACLTIATVVVQAARRSGARSTARAARALGRPLHVVTHSPWDPLGEGCEIEVALGARRFVSASALIESLRALDFRQTAASHACARADASRAGSASHAARASHAPSPGATRVLEAISETPLHIDDLCEQTALPFATVAAALLTLTLQAVVVEAPAGFYRRPPS